MPRLMRATVRIPYQSGLTRDVSENVYHFGGDGSQADIINFWSPLLVRLYNNYNMITGTGPDTLARFMSTIFDRTNYSHMLWAEVNPTTHHVSPVVADNPFVLGAVDPGAAINLPLEVALCGSIKSQISINSGVLPRRARGRLYYGPFNDKAITGGNVYPSPSTGVVALIRAQQQALGKLSFISAAVPVPPTLTRATADQGSFAIYSRTDGAAYPVDSGWLDNEWDTQRRRQVKATARNAWTSS